MNGSFILTGVPRTSGKRVVELWSNENHREAQTRSEKKLLRNSALAAERYR